MGSLTTMRLGSPVVQFALIQFAGSFNSINSHAWSPSPVHPPLNPHSPWENAAAVRRPRRVIIVIPIGGTPPVHLRLLPPRRDPNTEGGHKAVKGFVGDVFEEPVAPLGSGFVLLILLLLRGFDFSLRLGLGLTVRYSAVGLGLPVRYSAVGVGVGVNSALQCDWGWG